MKSESVVIGVAGVIFGVLVGWMLGAQQAGRSPSSPVAASAPAPAEAPAQGASAPPQGGARTPAALDPARVQELEARATAVPKDAAPRKELGNLYFDADRFADAARWYEAALAIEPNDPDTSTDLGICYYYLDQAPRAIRQFEASLAANPRHTKTLLNLGIVRAFGTQDLKGAADAWQQVVAIAPADSPEARAARQALEGLRTAHPDIAGAAATPKQGT